MLYLGIDQHRTQLTVKLPSEDGFAVNSGLWKQMISIVTPKA